MPTKAKSKELTEAVSPLQEKNKTKSFSPFQVHAQCGLDLLTPITSIRRCISNLTRDKFLVKNKEKESMIDGEYNTPNHTWTLVKNN